MLLLVQDVGEACSGVLELHGASRLELASKTEEELRDLRTVVQLGLDACECAAVIPERTVRSGAAVGMALGDELDGAELPVLGLWLHGPTVPGACAAAIVATTDSAAGSYLPGTRVRVRACESGRPAGRLPARRL